MNRLRYCRDFFGLFALLSGMPLFRQMFLFDESWGDIPFAPDNLPLFVFSLGAVATFGVVCLYPTWGRTQRKIRKGLCLLAYSLAVLSGAARDPVETSAAYLLVSILVFLIGFTYRTRLLPFVLLLAGIGITILLTDANLLQFGLVMLVTALGYTTIRWQLEIQKRKEEKPGRA